MRKFSAIEKTTGKNENSVYEIDKRIDDEKNNDEIGIRECQN